MTGKMRAYDLIKKKRDGMELSMDEAEKAGIAAMLLGGGRQRAEDVIDHSAGIVINKKVGDYITPDEPVAIFHYNDESRLKDAEEVFFSGVQLSEIPPDRKAIIIEVIL